MPDKSGESNPAMSANERYELVFNGPPELVEARELLESKKPLAQSMWDMKVKLYANDDTPESWYEELRAELFAEHGIDVVQDKIKDLEEQREQELQELALKVEFEPDPVWLYYFRGCRVGTYSTQGYGAHTYASASVKPLHDKLISVGFDSSIWYQGYKEEARPANGNDSGGYGGTGEYQVWANADEWQTDAVSRLITLADMSKSWGRTINPLVINPFLPDWFVNRHYAQSWET
jgi:hypothetical protein